MHGNSKEDLVVQLVQSTEWRLEDTTLDAQDDIKPVDWLKSSVVHKFDHSSSVNELSRRFGYKSLHRGFRRPVMS